MMTRFERQTEHLLHRADSAAAQDNAYSRDDALRIVLSGGVLCGTGFDTLWDWLRGAG